MSRRILSQWAFTDVAVQTAAGNFTAVNEAGVCVKKTSGQATTVTLPPASSAETRFFFVKDAKGDAATNNITVQGAASATIDGASSHLININYGSALYCYNPKTAEWSLVENKTVSTGGYVIESATDSLTAHSGGGQGSALALTAQTNRVSTVALAGDSVSLPAATAGLEIALVNSGANAMQVFGAGTDTIDDVAAATGVSQMVNSIVLYICPVNGKWYTDGMATGYSGSLMTQSFLTGVTAHSGGTQALAVPLTAMYNRVTTVAAQGDSVLLPASAAGLEITVNNRGANAMQVFGAGTDTINGIATATGISHGVNQIATYVCGIAGNWEVQFSLPQQSGYVLLAANAAIPPHVAHDYMITKTGSACLLTLAAPTAGADDGLTITISSDTAFAHTVTCGAGVFKNGGAATTVFTFTGTTSGGGLTLKAYNATWKVMSSTGGAFS